jgi:hypothetical protein
MRTFAVLMAVIGCFVFLLNQFSFWIAFGMIYLSGLLLVALIAMSGRFQGAAWNRCQELADMECETCQTEAE